MKFTESWLRTLVDPKIDTETLADQLTMLGLEVDAVTPVAPKFNNVIIGEIIQAEQHPDADRLRVCLVNVGGKELLNIVCGAPNARPGIRVAVATIGAVLPGDFEIKEAKLRGVLSQGMLCAQDELGLAKTMEGILELPLDAPVGQNIRKYLSLDDAIFDINLTPNRGDCLSMVGIAREVALKNKLQMQAPKGVKIIAKIKDKVTISLRAPEACPLYVGRIIKKIDNTVATPAYIATRLTHSGVRCISPVVDILNYVMLLIGQPMHAFDLKKIHGNIVVRFAVENETLGLLNGTEAHLKPNTLVIADAQKPLAIAGVMGGSESEVAADTDEILLEAAYFKPECIVGRARQYNLQSDSAQRFERGVDPNLAHEALELATHMILDVCGGEAANICETRHKSNLPKNFEIIMYYAHLEKLLGSGVDVKEIAKILDGIGCELIKQTKDFIKVKTPCWRFDLHIAEDLIEEIARVHGYDKFAPIIPSFPLQVRMTKEVHNSTQAIKDFLCARGMTEVITFSFVDPKEHQYFKDDRQARVLTNPLSSDLSEMRLSLMTSLLKVLQYNERRQVENVRIFEVGRIYETNEITMLGGLLYGQREPHNWQGNALIDFYDLKGLLEALFHFTLIDQIEFKNQGLPSWVHPGQSLSIWLNDKKIGYMGALHPQCQSAFDLKHLPYLFEIELSALSVGKPPKANPVSKFPSIRRDLALIIPEAHSAEIVLSVIKKVPGDLLADAYVFDVYQGEHVAKGHKSLAIALLLQHKDHTLVDTEVDQYIQGVVARLQSKLNAVLRT